MAKNKNFELAPSYFDQSTIGGMMKEAAKEDLNILPELQEYIRSLKPYEYAQLEQSIIEEGCLDPLKIWRGADDKVYIVDGHHRFEICKKHNKPFKTEKVYFENIAQVKEYMIQLQLGRRNLTKQELSYYRGLHFHMYKNDFGVRKYKENEGSTASQLSNIHGVSERTITRDALITSLLDRLSPKQKQAYLAGESKITRKMLEDGAKETESIEAFLDYLKEKTGEEKPTKGKEKIAKLIDPIEPDLNDLKEPNYLDIFKEKITSMPKGWKENISDDDRQVIILKLEEMLKDLKNT